jgi:uncharacterized protein with GYD domain
MKGQVGMATYVSLLKFTEQGVKKLKDTCKRAADFKESARKLGLEVKEQYWCMGRYDGLIVFEAPDDDAATGGMLALSSQDNVTTQTLRCFTAVEMGKIIGKLA